MHSRSKELPLYKNGHRGWQQEDQQENRELFSKRVSRLRHTHPHVRRCRDTPDDDKRDGRCDHRCSARTGKELCNSQTRCPQHKAHSNDDCGAHGSLPSLAPDRRDGYRNITLSVSGRSTNEYYSTILFLGSNGAGKSVSPSISRKSISAVRHICEIGTSFALPSNGFSVLSPTRTSEVYIQEINTLKGMTSQTMLPLITPSTLSLRLV